MDEYVGIGRRSASQVSDFCGAVDVCGLIDIGYTGKPWTFEKKVMGGTYT